jgi:hypothetical protein
LWKKYVVSWEVEVAWRRGKVVVVSFTKALNAFETIRAFMYAHDITDIDQANIISIESLLLIVKRKDATKQMISDFLKKK